MMMDGNDDGDDDDDDDDDDVDGDDDEASDSLEQSEGRHCPVRRATMILQCHF